MRCNTSPLWRTAAGAQARRGADDNADARGSRSRLCSRLSRLSSRLSRLSSFFFRPWRSRLPLSILFLCPRSPRCSNLVVPSSTSGLSLSSGARVVPVLGSNFTPVRAYPRPSAFSRGLRIPGFFTGMRPMRPPDLCPGMDDHRSTNHVLSSTRRAQVDRSSKQARDESAGRRRAYRRGWGVLGTEGPLALGAR